jgi:hypothetical protein
VHDADGGGVHYDGEVHAVGEVHDAEVGDVHAVGEVLAVGGEVLCVDA